MPALGLSACKRPRLRDTPFARWKRGFSRLVEPVRPEPRLHRPSCSGLRLSNGCHTWSILNDGAAPAAYDTCRQSKFTAVKDKRRCRELYRGYKVAALMIGLGWFIVLLVVMAILLVVGLMAIAGLVHAAHYLSGFDRRLSHPRTGTNLAGG